MFCIHCGHPLSDGDRFCMHCGARVTAAPAPEAPQPASEPVMAQTPVEPVVPQTPAQPEVHVENPENAASAPTEPVVPLVENVPTEPAVPPVENIPTEPAVPPVENVPTEPTAPPAENTPTQEATPFTPYDAPQYGMGEPFAPPEKPKKKRKALIIAIAVVAVLAIAAVCTFLFRPTEVANGSITENAAAKTAAQLEEVLGNCENLDLLWDNFSTIAASGQLTVRLGVDYSASYGGAAAASSLDLSLNYDGEGRKLDGVLSMEGVELEFYADEADLLIRCADFDDSYFKVPLANFGEAFAASPLAALLGVEDMDALKDFGISLFAQTNWDDFAEKNPDAAEFVESLNFFQNDATIPNAEGMTVYECTFDAEEFSELFAAWTKYFYGETFGGLVAESTEMDDLFAWTDEDNKLTVQIGVNEDGYLAALHLFPEGEDESFTLVLCGESNLFEEIKFYENGELFYTASLEKTEDGFTLSGGEDEISSLLTCKDGDFALTVYDEDGSELLTAYYDTAKNGASFEIAFAQSESDIDDIDDMFESAVGGYATFGAVRITVDILPFEGVETPSGKTVALFELTESELEELAQRLMGLIYGA